MVVTRHPRVETLGYYWSRICAPKGRTTSALIIAQDFSPGWPCVWASDKEVAQDFSPGWPCVQVLGSRQKKGGPSAAFFIAWTSVCVRVPAGGFCADGWILG